MSRWHNRYLDGHAHFCTATASDRRPVLVDRADDLLYRQWNAARELLDMRVLAYVVMPDHIHLMLWSNRGSDIRKFLQRTLSLSARAYGAAGRFWKERPRVLPICSEDICETKIDYLHANPVRRGLVATPGEWVHSSYRQLACGADDVVFACDAWDGLLR
jgi:putative transposase